MPCNTGQGEGHTDWDAHRQIRELKEEADKVTAILCKILRALPHEYILSMGPETVEWFEKHKAWDASQGRP